MGQSNLWKVTLTLAYVLLQAQLGSYDIIYGLELVPMDQAVQCGAQLCVQVEDQKELRRHPEIHHRCPATENLKVSLVESDCVHCRQVQA